MAPNGTQAELIVENLTNPVNISVPVANARDLVTSCTGQPDVLEVFDRQSKMPGCDKTLECRFWDEAAEQWSTEGCETTLYNASGSVAIGCSCSHLSDFVAVEVPTDISGTLRYGMLRLPRLADALEGATATKFDMTIVRRCEARTPD